MVAIVLLVALLGQRAAGQVLSLHTLSGRPDMVSGGTALVEIRGEAGAAVSADLNGRDVSTAFRARRGAKTLVGRVEGLRSGKNLLVVRAGSRRARLELVNHPISGPVFSGPHQSPFVCQTEAAGLGAPVDENCTAKTQVLYYYRTTEKAPAGATKSGDLPAGLKPFDPAAPRPPDLAETTTTEGQRVPLILRREIGVINRAIYQIWMLHDPSQLLPDPWSESRFWNGRLVYSFGGGCMAGYRQGRLPADVDVSLVARGFAIASSSLNVLGNNCNDVISAETMMMVKEYFIKTFGVPAYTIGMGGSGGSIQQHLIAQNYPGLLDGITPSASYPDVVSIGAPVADCALLARYFESSSLNWTEEQKTAVSGFATWGTCLSWMKRYSPGWLRPDFCDVSMPKDRVYDPVSNPKGARCTLQDNQVNVYGRDPKTGFARRPLDNVGVQYGLEAFNAGKITAKQFLELNERIGGFDMDGNIVSVRTLADPQALLVAYRTGRVNAAGGSLGSIPIIDLRRYLDPKGDIHDRVRSFQTRARLVKAHGTSANQVILTEPKAGNAILLMDQWLSRIRSDRVRGAPRKRLRATSRKASWTRVGIRRGNRSPNLPNTGSPGGATNCTRPTATRAWRLERRLPATSSSAV